MALRSLPKVIVLAICVGLVAFPHQEAATSGQRNIDQTNYKAFFDDLERKGAYLEITEESNLSERTVFLGAISKSAARSDSLANKYGSYGSKHSATSIFNRFGSYGSKFSNTSPFNQYALNPPEILYKLGGKTYIAGYLTKNKYYVGDYVVPKVDPKYLFMWLGREDELPND